MSDNLKLYRVTIEYEIFAVGKDEEEAIHAARRGVGDEMAEERAREIVMRAASKYLPAEVLDSVPWGNGDGTSTVRELIAALAK